MLHFNTDQEVKATAATKEGLRGFPETLVTPTYSLESIKDKSIVCGHENT